MDFASEEFCDIIDELKNYMEYIGPTSQSGVLEDLIRLAEGYTYYLSDDMQEVLMRDILHLHEFFTTCTEEQRVEKEVTKTIINIDLVMKGNTNMDVHDAIQCLKWSDKND